MVKTGGSLTGVTVIVNAWAALASVPPFAVPPLSFNCTETDAVPFALGAVVKVSVPADETAGWTRKSVGSLLVTAKVKV